MQEVIKVLIGIVFLFVGYFLGNFIAKLTKEELKSGQKWFKLIILVSLISAVVSLFFLNDILFFSFCFIALFTSRSLKNNIR